MTCVKTIFRKLKNIFTKRNENNKTKVAVSSSMRNKVFMTMADSLQQRKMEDCMNFVSRSICYKKGVLRLCNGSATAADDAINFMDSCDDREFLDCVEMVFLWTRDNIESWQEEDLIESLNECFRSEETAEYELTPRVFAEVNTGIRRGRAAGFIHRESIADPQIILKTDDLLHEETVRPAFNLLASSQDLSVPLAEFLKGNSEIREGKFADAITSFCNSLESVVKVVGSRKGWKTTGSLDSLLSVLVSKKFLLPCHRKAIDSVGVLRDALGDCHGRVNSPKATFADAKMALHFATAAIKFLVERVNER